MCTDKEVRVVALCGNPNVGKSTIFNALTGMRQHTGNWPGKTVSSAYGSYYHDGYRYKIVDLPGCYSLEARSEDEAAACSFLRDCEPDAVIVVCDATCLERNLILALQTIELGRKTIVCVNLMDEAQKKGIHIDLQALSRRLGVPVTGTAARSRTGLEGLQEAVARAIGEEASKVTELRASEASAVETAEDICAEVIRVERDTYLVSKADRILTGRRAAFPVMFLALLCILWLTVTGANIPSKLLADGLFRAGDRLLGLLVWLGVPDIICDVLVMGVYRVLAWVVSVMLPPMAIFFPLFTLLEDAGFLPRIAFNLDKVFARCRACGKQALTMCMGFGCNAVGVTGCRIIDSPREKLIAILTNSFIPCNGRFPILIAVISMFLVGNTVISALFLTIFIMLSVCMSLLASGLLSKTLLKGLPSFFTLELPPYRRPQFVKVIVRSFFDRTLFVLGRAAVVAAPAGLLIWLFANIQVGGNTLLAHCSGFLDPFARLLGLDGVILLAFILGFPANETVIPIIIMAYMAQGYMTDYGSLSGLKALFIDNGWTWITAVSVLLFSLMHWPCSTTCLTVYRETKSVKWTLCSILLPTAFGMACCFLFANAARLITGL